MPDTAGRLLEDGPYLSVHVCVCVLDVWHLYEITVTERDSLASDSTMRLLSQSHYLSTISFIEQTHLPGPVNKDESASHTSFILFHLNSTSHRRRVNPSYAHEESVFVFVKSNSPLDMLIKYHSRNIQNLFGVLKAASLRKIKRLVVINIP